MPKKTAPKAPPKAKGKSKRPAKPAKASVVVQSARPAPKGRGKKAAPVKTAKQILREAPKTKQEVQADKDRFEPPVLKVKDLFGALNFVDQKGKKTKLSPKDYDDIFQPEIDAELEREAEIVNDRTAHWRCQCCDVVLRVPRRTEVIHGDYHLAHDDKRGLLVNGDKFIPRTETPIEVQQPGRLRNPWTGDTLSGPKVRSA